MPSTDPSGEWLSRRRSRTRRHDTLVPLPLGTAFLCSCLAFTAPGCSRTASPAAFVDAFDIAPGSTFAALNGDRFGGVSGLAFDPASNELLGLSDDRTNSRVFRLAIHDDPLRIEPVGAIRLRGTPVGLDPEGIALLPNGHFVVSSEGLQNEEPRQPPGLFEYTHDGTFVSAFPVRSKYLPPERGAITTGVRGNSSFEPLALAPDGGTLFTGTEQPLVQDGEVATVDHGARTRLMEYTRQGDMFVPSREWLYELDPAPRPDFPPAFSVTGLVELLALEGGGLLAMERSYVSEAGESGRDLNRIRIYRVSVDGASDVSALDSVQGRTDLRPVSKRLVLDLGSTPGLPRALEGLENFEGLAIVPARSTGRRLLLMVSDDNFSKRQRTWFVRMTLP